MTHPLHICLVTFISFISNTKVQLIHFVIHFHLIHSIDHSLFHSHLPYVLILIWHGILASLSLLFFNQSHLWKVRVSLDKTLIWNCNIWGWIRMVLLLPCYFIRITAWCQNHLLRLETMAKTFWVLCNCYWKGQKKWQS